MPGDTIIGYRDIEPLEDEYLLALKYENGIGGTTIDLTKCFEMYYLSSLKGYVLSTFRLAKCYKNGIGIAKSNNKAIQLLEKASSDGLFDASFYLYSTKFHKKSTTTKFCTAIEDEDVTATYNLAYRFRHGRGAEKDLKKAIELYQRCADQNHLPSLNSLAEMLGRGDNNGGQPTRKDLERSMELFHMASKQGYSISSFNLAYNYRKREGEQEDQEIVNSLFEKADEQDMSLGLLTELHYETMYKKGYKGPFHSKRTEEFFRKLQNEHDFCQGKLKLSSLGGICTTENMIQAAELYEKASNNGYILATSRLARCYENGAGVGKNIEKAVILYEKAAAAGVFEASEHLANIMTSEHIEKYQRGVDSGDSTSIYLLAWYWKIKGNKSKAKVLLKKSKNHPPSIHLLAMMYMESFKEYKGISLLKKSAALGFSLSSWTLMTKYCDLHNNKKVKVWAEKAKIQDLYLGLLSDTNRDFLETERSD